MASRISIFGTVGFIVGVLPLLAFTFFSPGLGAEGVWGGVTFILGLVALALLMAAARRNRWLWALAVIQLLLLAGVLVETFSDSVLYIGT